MVTADPSEHREEALECALQELNRRKVPIPREAFDRARAPLSDDPMEGGRGIAPQASARRWSGARFMAFIIVLAVIAVWMTRYFSFGSDSSSILTGVGLSGALWWFVWSDRALFASWRSLSVLNKIRESRIVFGAIFITIMTLVLIARRLLFSE